MNKTIGSLSDIDIRLIHEDFKEHIDDGKSEKYVGIVVVLDVLGWKKIANPRLMKQYFDLINRLRFKINDTYLRHTDQTDLLNVRISVLSDTVIICIDGSYPYCELNIFGAINNFVAESLGNGIIYRGAISYGEYYINRLGNAFIGSPIYEALKLAEKTDWSGIIITDSLASVLLENNSVDLLSELNIISYSSIPFKHGYNTMEHLVLYPDLKCLGYRISIKTVTELKSLYEKIMLIGKEPANLLKYHNTCVFLDYLESIGWFE